MLQTTKLTLLAMAGAIGILTVAPTYTKSQPISTPTITVQDKQQIKCLADNIYHEARNQPEKGKIAVLNVVQNRVEDRRFPKTHCGVIKQKTGRTCQFSWVCSGKKPVSESTSYKYAYKLSEQFYTSPHKVDVTYGAKFYHAKYVNPRWRYKRTVTIGDHIFYKG